MHQQFPQAPLLPKSATNLAQFAVVNGSNVSDDKKSILRLDFAICNFFAARPLIVLCLLKSGLLQRTKFYFNYGYSVETGFKKWGQPHCRNSVTTIQSARQTTTSFLCHLSSDLGYYDAWMRYLNGFAEITFEYWEMEASFSCRIYKSWTIIYSLELHFYDEAYEPLTLTEDFKRYVASNLEKIQQARLNRDTF